MSRSFVPSTISPQEPRSAWWFAYLNNQLLVEELETEIRLPQAHSLAEIGLEPIRTQFLGMLDDQPCYCAELAPETTAPVGMRFEGLREVYGQLEDDLFAIAGRAIQIMEWDRTHQFCGHCATPTTQSPHERSKRCPNCGLVSYPRLSPAVIVLIHRGEEILLARAPRFPSGMYSVLAGFVEPGESLEETIVREVYEEAGITVRDIRYFGSQPWPFPNSLMIGFTAAYAGGELTLDPQELEAAAWFHKSTLPKIPPKLSIARKLIDWFCDVDPVELRLAKRTDTERLL
ncbi:MAG: NAD(+) diphosphatase [Myxacorys chilensis ATA2-1-KO14]|jgi:NAD+ diphosphatase|nr:NAD(+) diphosphatase [Myxacorys chilensis ATA2-1-KO14]